MFPFTVRFLFSTVLPEKKPVAGVKTPSVMVTVFVAQAGHNSVGVAEANITLPPFCPAILLLMAPMELFDEVEPATIKILPFIPLADAPFALIVTPDGVLIDPSKARNIKSPPLPVVLAALLSSVIPPLLVKLMLPPSPDEPVSMKEDPLTK